MTWPDFAWDVASNTVATVIGIFGGVPAALWVERWRQARADEADDARRRVERNAVMARRAEKQRAKAARRREDIQAIARALDECIQANIVAVDRAATEVSMTRIAMYSAFDLFTWNALHGRVVELLQDPALIGSLARFFANLQAFERLVDVHLRQDAGYSKQVGLQNRIVQLGPELRLHGETISQALRTRFLGAESPAGDH
jgi:hypothetical protein